MIIPLNAPARWAYDTTTGEILLLLYQAPEADQADPVRYTPTQRAVVRLKVASVNLLPAEEVPTP